MDETGSKRICLEIPNEYAAKDLHLGES